MGQNFSEHAESISLDPKDIDTVKEYWKYIRTSHGVIGPQIMHLHLATFPEDRRYYESLNPNSPLEVDPIVICHGIKFYMELDQMVKDMNKKYELVMQRLYTIAIKHKRYKIKTSAWMHFRSAILTILIIKFGFPYAAVAVYRKALNTMFQIIINLTHGRHPDREFKVDPKESRTILHIVSDPRLIPLDHVKSVFATQAHAYDFLADADNFSAGSKPSDASTRNQYDNNDDRVEHEYYKLIYKKLHPEEENFNPPVEKHRGMLGREKQTRVISDDETDSILRIAGYIPTVFRTQKRQSIEAKRKSDGNNSVESGKNLDKIPMSVIRMQRRKYGLM